VADAQRGSLLEELGRARDAVETIVKIVETVAEVSFFTLFFEVSFKWCFLLGGAPVCETRVAGCDSDI
jgi:hypothetical protein